MRCYGAISTTFRMTCPARQSRARAGARRLAQQSSGPQPAPSACPRARGSAGPPPLDPFAARVLARPASCDCLHTFLQSPRLRSSTGSRVPPQAEALLGQTHQQSLARRPRDLPPLWPTHENHRRHRPGPARRHRAYSAAPQSLGSSLEARAQGTWTAQGFPEHGSAAARPGLGTESRADHRSRDRRRALLGGRDPTARRSLSHPNLSLPAPAPRPRATLTSHRAKCFRRT
jgi:hypothetical protein